MFRLEKLEVVHWDFWQRLVLPLDAAIVTIVGSNGSGKTTLLDALRTLLALDCSKSAITSATCGATAKISAGCAASLTTAASLRASVLSGRLFPATR